jgi:lipopolysaccharide/colanic/teichoic acid biosynthesis glycosyltransferase
MATRSSSLDIVRHDSSVGDEFPLPIRLASRAGQAQLALKRLLDVVLSAAALVILAPFLLVIAALIWADSGWPVLYPWKVVGYRGRYFTSYKLRTMVRNADALYDELASQNEMSGPVFKMKADPRVTRIGRVLRKYSLDELPQLWSVLIGDMSLVGPRPPLQREWERFEAWQRQKLAVTPGITCLWQVSGRADIQDFDEWARLDLEYIRRWSLWLDLTILWRTVSAVLSRRGAY